LFGPAADHHVHLRTPKRAAGLLELQRATVQWFLSSDRADLSFEPEPGVRTSYRSIVVDNEEIEFTGGFADLHTRVYEQTLAGRGFGIDDARPSIALTHAIRHASLPRGVTV
jgi:UDP-N-acetyl-2-amino-2-deoxyglucuronate dehydrogenase